MYNIHSEVRGINTGKIFEKDIKNSIPKDVFYYRIKDPAQAFGENSTTRFSLKNDFDAFLYKYPTLVAVELKSNGGTSISFSLSENKVNIKANQIKCLSDCLKFNIRAGLILNFRKSEKTYWIDISDFLLFANNTSKKSINEKDLKEYRAIEIPHVKKKVNFIYDLNFLFDKKE